jgi:hypothetical protein
LNLEALIESPQGFGMTGISPVQRAICRVMTGEPLEELAHDPDVVTMLGGAAAVAGLSPEAPDMLVLGAAVRCGKSTIVAAKALRNAYLGDCSGLAPGEVPRVAILSVDLDKARETFSKIVGALATSPWLSQLLVKPPGTDSVIVRNHSGWPVEIKVVAGARAGKTLVSRWLLGFIADEAPRMVGEDEGVVNLDDALSAIRARMRKGAQIDLVGSLWAPRGPVFNYVTERHGKPGQDLVVMLATGPMLRPELYTPEYCDRIRKADDRAYEADVMSRFADPISALLASVNVTACTRADERIGRTAAQGYVAVIDPATRGNGWTLVIIGTRPQGGFEVCVAREWIGSRSAPLKASQVLPEIGEELRQFGIDECVTDQAGYDHLADIAELVNVGFTLKLATRNDDIAIQSLRHLFAEKLVSIPNIAQLKTDLIAIRTRPRAAGGSQVVLIKTTDGRHCDYGAAMLLGAQLLPAQPAPETLDDRDDEQRWCEMMQRNQQTYDQGAAARLTGYAL